MSNVVEYAVFGGLMCANLGFGLYFSCLRRLRKEATTDEMFLGSRSLRIVPLAGSVLASMLSAIGIIGFSAHYYAYGFHYLWNFVSVPLIAVFVSKVVIPVLYELKVTSVFQYLRMRYGNEIGLTACAIYFFISVTTGAVALFTASVAISTIFNTSLFWSTIGIGVASTTYTALGGMRGVVWTDCVQSLLILMAPVTVVTKVVYDSYQTDVHLRPSSDFNIREYLFEASLDFTKDENVWACMVGLFVHGLFRSGMDQVVVQRYLAARKLKEAQSISYIGITLNTIYNLIMAGMAVALVYWYRDCDPLLSGAISKLDQMLPYYVKENLGDFPGFSGLFLTGVVSAATSTISSIINSQAAVFYVDVVSQYKKFTVTQAAAFTKRSALFFGCVLTASAVAVPYLGSAVRLVLVLHSGGTSPFVGLFVLGLAFPWANAKGAAVGTLVAGSLQLWLMFGKIALDIRSPRMAVTLDYCPINSSFPAAGSPAFEHDEALSLGGISDLRDHSVLGFYRLSAYWSLIVFALLTIALGVAVSLLTGGKKTCADNFHLTSKPALRLWRKMKLLPTQELKLRVQGEEEDEKDILHPQFRDESSNSNESNVFG
ncbi:sodium-coupled monocarboxylate transporter 2-like isoform X3 [Haemaphysalis longicornis]